MDRSSADFDPLKARHAANRLQGQAYTDKMRQGQMILLDVGLFPYAVNANLERYREAHRGWQERLSGTAGDLVVAPHTAARRWNGATQCIPSTTIASAYPA